MKDKICLVKAFRGLRKEEYSLRSTTKLADVDIEYQKLLRDLGVTGIPWSQLGVVGNAANASPATTAGRIFQNI